MKTPHILLFFIIFSLGHSLYSQINLPAKAYFRLTGTLNHGNAIEMNLVKVNDSLYGSCFIGVPPVKSTSPVEGEGSVFNIYGSMMAKTGFLLRENPWGKGASWHGQFSDAQNITGVWESMDGQHKQSFELHDTYPSGSIRMSVYYRKGFMPLIKKPGAPKANLEYTLLVPSESGNMGTTDTLKKLILGRFCNKPVRIMDPDKLLNGMQQVYFDNYISDNEAIYKETSGASFNWESIKSMNIILNRSNLFTFFILDYSFTGGAHGLEVRNYYVVNLSTGKQIKSEELFRKDSETDLSNLITAKLKEMNRISPSQKLSDNGFFTDLVKPSQNFYISPNGIGFFYNHYDIAPYASGPEDVFISFDELKPYLLEDSPVRSIFR